MIRCAFRDKGFMSLMMNGNLIGVLRVDPGHSFEVEWTLEAPKPDSQEVQRAKQEAQRIENL